MPNIVPQDRTCKQPARGYCMNPLCMEKRGERFEFDTEHSPVVCPKCKADKSPLVGVLVLIHFLYHDPAGGPITGSDGMDYRVACDTERAYLATVTNQEAASGDISVVNCAGCLKAAKDKKLAKVQGWALFADKP